MKKILGYQVGDIVRVKGVKVTDSDILYDLEYRGVANLVADIQSGLFYVPESLVTRIKKIIEKEFSMDLVTGEISEEKESGHFCLLPFANQRQVQLIEKENL